MRVGNVLVYFVYQKYYYAQKCAFYSGGSGHFVKKKRRETGAVCYRFNSALLNGNKTVHYQSKIKLETHFLLDESFLKIFSSRGFYMELNY